MDEIFSAWFLYHSSVLNLRDTTGTGFMLKRAGIQAAIWLLLVQSLVYSALPFINSHFGMFHQILPDQLLLLSFSRFGRRRDKISSATFDIGVGVPWIVVIEVVQEVLLVQRPWTLDSIKLKSSNCFKGLRLAFFLVKFQLFMWYSCIFGIIRLIFFFSFVRLRFDLCDV